MTLRHFTKIRPWLALISASSLAIGCASVGQSDNAPGKIRITSEPVGAVAYADGSELGTTPLEIVPGNYFRSGFVGFSYRYFGKLSMKKAGCETWSTEVNDYILSKDVNATLKCDPNFQPASTSTPSVTGTSVSMPSSPATDQTVERLERLETLHKKGLISDDEYKQLRARVLDKL
ncbi:MAG: PEGA domain-containing protein [Thiobacillaceae bacterium]|jgi:hypothetical protein